MTYRPVFSDEAVTFFLSQPRRRQRILLDRARSLALHLFATADYTTSDTEGRDMCHQMVGAFIFTYWVDHAVRVVMITEIDYAE